MLHPLIITVHFQESSIMHHHNLEHPSESSEQVELKRSDDISVDGPASSPADEIQKKLAKASLEEKDAQDK
jgi:hypothetical protein